MPHGFSVADTRDAGRDMMETVAAHVAAIHAQRGNDLDGESAPIGEEFALEGDVGVAEMRGFEFAHSMFCLVAGVGTTTENAGDLFRFSLTACSFCPDMESITSKVEDLARQREHTAMTNQEADGKVLVESSSPSESMRPIFEEGNDEEDGPSRKRRKRGNSLEQHENMQPLDSSLSSSSRHGKTSRRKNLNEKDFSLVIYSGSAGEVFMSSSIFLHRNGNTLRTENDRCLSDVGIEELLSQTLASMKRAIQNRIQCDFLISHFLCPFFFFFFLCFSFCSENGFCICLNS